MRPSPPVLAELEALHVEDDGECDECRWVWPCPDAQLLAYIRDLEALLAKWIPHLRAHGCDGLGLEYAEEVAAALAAALSYDD